ncbi:hypothetical protein PL9631_590097 [Planktothrix paucivesiculata PCC 9631]|uniref:Uncharacterized protein n=1 Tax=Planktothrix paucivesiculata PCC 9631 TaxID=671071 RepID=A0A7Z9BS83_9CYAN|nr:hypothetical protein PL9631_590097 [Planktothrix paucivesiculata PCC 9631]
MLSAIILICVITLRKLISIIEIFNFNKNDQHFYSVLDSLSGLQKVKKL